MPTPPDAAPPSDQQTVGFSSPAGPTEVGARVDEYVLQGEIGRGGMGVVFKAFEPGLGRYVAIKMVLAGAVGDPAELQRFQAEASAAARLHHPNIVKVHRVGVHDSCHYFSMDYIAGPTLAQRLADGPLPGRVAARYLVAVARAIQHAHAQGILHRDLKPSNILLDENDQPQVADFGLAKQLSADRGQTRTGVLLGTPSYMAPEQAQGSKELSPATDVYGLGALLYELVTARPPFRGETPFDTVLQVLHNDPAPPRLLNPRVDRDLETICLKCLAKGPRDRYDSAEAVAHDLERYLAGETILARSLNMLDYVGRALERSHFDVEFRQYGNLILWFALIVFVLHLAEHAVMATRQPIHLIRGVKAVQFFLMGVALWWYRPRRMLPATTAERLLWSVWISYIVTCSVIGQLLYVQFGIGPVHEGVAYPFFCAVSGMAFCILGSSYWGACYAISVAFFALSGVLLLDTSWGPLAFGGLWTLALVAIGLRLRRLGRERGGQ